MPDPTWPAATARLSIRPASASDAEAVWAFRQLDAVGRWLTSAPATYDAFREQFTAPAHLAKTLVIEHDDTVIGDLMLSVLDGYGYALLADDWRAARAARAARRDP